MSFRYNMPVLGILNETDAPHQNMIVVVYGNPDKPRWAYVVPRATGNGDHQYQEPELFARLQDFGVQAVLTPDGRLSLHVMTVSVARYPDGKPRQWQGPQSSAVDIHRHVSGYVLEAVKAEAAARRQAKAHEAQAS